ncbi:hypothetical protein A9Q84_06470 [Halobacteriovorax marinus]|uniref:Uncharacterized protein n=1 Tax=Halobacteriovorax marinus TaxID=97084 RepID=A0A1Y5F9X8_9BACT|nr:hypothetical protein A9Q84_06470 [Halobacteriovorax marinus]
MKYLFILLLLVGCTHNTRLVSKGCFGSGKYSETNAEYKKHVEGVFYFGMSDEVSLKEILAKENIDCRKIKYMNFTWKQGFFESLVSVLPLMTSKTLIIDYALK